MVHHCLRKLNIDSSSGSDGKNLTAFIKAACGTDPVGDIGSGALWADAQLGQSQNTIIRPALALAAS
jgi:hypothetical protein